MRKAAFIAAVIIAASPVRVCADGINSLIEFGKSAADIGAAMDEETRIFNRVKAAVDSGAIKKGLSKADIKSRYGEPVIVNDDFSTGREKWAYKPAGSSFFKGTRIYLLFDAKGNLDEVKILP